MTLFRELKLSEQRQISDEVIRQQTLIGDILLDVARRSVNFLLAILLVSALTVTAAGTHYAFNTTLLISALICYFIGIFCVGLILALNHQTLLSLIWKFGWFRFQILDSQADIKLLNAAPVRPPKHWVPLALGYTSFTLWALGVALSLCAFTVGITSPTHTTSSFTNSKVTPSLTTPATHDVPPAADAISAHAACALADKIAIGAVVAGIA